MIKLLKPRLTPIKPRLSPTSAGTPRLRGRRGASQRDKRLQRTNYLCEMCQAEGHVRLADAVDHIIPLALGGPDTDENTRNLCTEHHRHVTATQFGHKRKQAIGPDGWPK